MTLDYEAVGPDVRETSCPGGPLLLRGVVLLSDGDGKTWPVTRPAVALCRCRRSDRLPWCDGSHKLTPEQAAESSPTDAG